MSTSVPVLDLEGFKSSETKRYVKPFYRVGLDIYPHGSDPFWSDRSTKARKLNWIKGETEGTIMGWSWRKGGEDPAGQWSAVVKLGRDASIDVLRGDVQDGDWCDCYVNRNGVIFPVCRGRLLTVRQKTSSQGGATVRTLHLTGQDHGALFQTQLAWSNIWVQTLAEQSAGLYSQKFTGEPGGSPSEMFEKLIAGAFSNGTSATQSAWTLPRSLKDKTGGTTFHDILDVVLNDTRGYYQSETQLWTQAGGQDLNETLKFWCNPLLNEMFYDLDTLNAIGNYPKMQATIRERPFVNTVDGMDSPWFDLPMITIPDWLVSGSDIGRSGHERKTIFQLLCDFQPITGQEQTGLSQPLWSRDAVSKYGIQPMQESTKFATKSGDGEWREERRVWQQLFTDWHCVNPYLLNGSLEVGAMIPELRFGSRFRVASGEKDRDLTFYLEGLSHSYRYSTDGNSGPEGNSSVVLTRGFEGTDNEYLAAVKSVSSQFTETEL